ncbi:hypothetical protein GCM10010977_29700 [Citricoccus zhacaiensis]|uniref:DUF418 domain-containing protein n=3 Tax=Micrococcaceae TaxID=1268 RepID=A0ABQ2MAR7_9MICC|nr:hypothetical protein GCM10010977_29700 [Citricoccus zhacaiensis]VXC14074.1 Putative membrane protein YeiB [Citricoccus sp. K5]
MTAMGTVPFSFDQPDGERRTPRPSDGGTGQPGRDAHGSSVGRASDGQSDGRGQGGRLVGLDVARSMAIIGMIAVNVGPRGADGILGTLYDLPLGRASLLFMLLAGVGTSIMTRSVRAPSGASMPWRTLLWRAALLLVGGLALQLAGHEASVILPLYGLLFIACLPLLKAPGWLLAALSGASLVLGPLVWLAARRESDAFQVTEPTLLDPPAEILGGILFTGSYPLVVWAAPFLIGMLLGRIDLRNPALHRRLVLWGAVAAVGAYLLSQLLILVLGAPGRIVGLDRLVSATAHSQMPLWLVSSSGAALFVLGLCLMGERFASRHLSVLAATGRLSLTVYVGHLLALAVIVRPGPGSLAEGILVTAVLCTAAVVFSWLWTRRFQTGPLEILLRLPPRKTTSERNG